MVTGIELFECPDTKALSVVDWYRGYGATTPCAPRPEGSRPFVGRHLVPASSPEALSVKRHQSPLLARNGCGREMSGNLAYNLRLPRLVIGFFNML
jgi:hypothetical protein